MAFISTILESFNSVESITEVLELIKEANQNQSGYIKLKQKQFNEKMNGDTVEYQEDIILFTKHIVCIRF